MDGLVEDVIPVVKGVAVRQEKFLAALDVGHPGQAKKAHHPGDDVGLGHLVGVQHQDDLPLAEAEAEIKVAAFGVQAGQSLAGPGKIMKS